MALESWERWKRVTTVRGCSRRGGQTCCHPGIRRVPGEQSPDATTRSARPFPTLSQQGLEPAGHQAPATALPAGIALCPCRGWVSQDSSSGSQATLLGSSRALQDTGMTAQGSCIPSHHGHQAHCIPCSPQHPPPAAGSVGRQPWQKAPFCCLLRVSDSSLLLLCCMSQHLPGLLPAQPAHRALCHAHWNWMDTQRRKPREKTLK